MGIAPPAGFRVQGCDKSTTDKAVDGGAAEAASEPEAEILATYTQVLAELCHALL